MSAKVVESSVVVPSAKDTQQNTLNTPSFTSSEINIINVPLKDELAVESLNTTVVMAEFCCTPNAGAGSLERIANALLLLTIGGM